MFSNKNTNKTDEEIEEDLIEMSRMYKKIFTYDKQEIQKCDNSEKEIENTRTKHTGYIMWNYTLQTDPFRRIDKHPILKDSSLIPPLNVIRPTPTKPVKM